MTVTISQKAMLEMLNAHITQGPEVQVVKDDMTTDILVPEVSVKKDHLQLNIKLNQGRYTVIFIAVYVNKVLMFSETVDQTTNDDIDCYLILPIFLN